MEIRRSVEYWANIRVALKLTRAMKTEEQRLLEIVLCEQLPYGVKILIPDIYDHNRDEIKKLDEDLLKLFTRYKSTLNRPILHSMDQLTQEITVAGYNDGKPFVPLGVLNSMKIVEMGLAKFRTFVSRDDQTFLLADYYDGVNVCSISVVDLLNQWHFNWRNIPENLYVKATNEYQ